MILKSYIIEKNISMLDNYYAVLFYGENIGLKDDFKGFIKNFNKDYEKISIHSNDIIKNPNLLDEQISNTSLFSSKKIILINDCSEKIKNKIFEIIKDEKKDVKIFLFSENLDKKSSLRSYFEKEKNLAVVPCYQDNDKTLSIYLRDKLKDYQGLNQELINVIVKNSGSDRNAISHEIEKIKGLFLNKKIEPEKVYKLMNNAINLDFVNLRDCSLEANKAGLNKNLGNISLQNEKVYFYIGILTNRIHKLMELKRSIDEKKDVDIAIDNIRPRIFWKDKPIIKKQLRLWNIKKLEQAMKIVLETEVVIKTKINSLSNILIKKLLIELCNLAETNA